MYMYLWLTLEQEGNYIAFCTLHKYETSIATIVFGLSCGEWSYMYLWLTLEQEGNGIAFYTLHKYETSIATGRPLSH